MQTMKKSGTKKFVNLPALFGFRAVVLRRGVVFFAVFRFVAVVVFRVAIFYLSNPSKLASAESKFSEIQFTG